MDVKIANSWKQILCDEFSKVSFSNLVQFIRNEYANHKIYPPGKLIFSAFDHCSFENLKVVILGQDPYHGPNQANGLCFSVNDGVKMPPSLVNIFKEINNDLNIPMPATGNLERWADQGVLLLNATLTVRSSSPASHQNKGWEEFTDVVIRKISEENQNVVFVLWGAYAQRKGVMIDRNKHCVLESPHPSPFSADRGFFGCKHFSKTNEYLRSNGRTEINW